MAGVKVASVGEAGRHLDFQPVAPPFLGAPRSIFVHGPGVNRASQGVALVYDHPSYGRFLALELPNVMTDDDLARIAAGCHPETGCEGVWAVITLDDGRRALEIANPAASNGVLWLRSGIMFDVYGPASSLSSAEAVDLANAFAQSS